uniref:Uncharacterized protein n=1 Tax=Microcebus murinus TaxID=30608 RepID=A0A8C5XVM1_MICMU
MLTLASKLKRDDGLKGSRTSATASDSTRRVSVRDKLLVKEVAALEANLPCLPCWSTLAGGTCSLCPCVPPRLQGLAYLIPVGLCVASCSRRN